MVTIRRLHEAAYQPVPVLQKEPNGILQGPSIDLTMRRGFYTIVTPEGDCMKEPSLAASGTGCARNRVSRRRHLRLAGRSGAWF